MSRYTAAVDPHMVEATQEVLGVGEDRNAFDYTITISNFNSTYLRWIAPLIILVAVMFGGLAIYIAVKNGASFATWFLAIIAVGIAAGVYLMLRGGHTMRNILNDTGVSNVTIGKQAKLAKSVAVAGVAAGIGTRSITALIAGLAATPQLYKVALWSETKKVTIIKKSRRVLICADRLNGVFKPTLWCTPDNFDAIATYVKMHMPESATLVEK